MKDMSHFQGVKTYPDLSFIFSGWGQDPLTPGSTPLPRAPQFWRFYPAYTYILWRRSTKFCVVTHVRKGVF